MNIAFVHQSFPGQYLYLAPAMARRGHKVIALTLWPAATDMPGVTIAPYRLRHTSAPGIHPWASTFETQVVHGERVAFTALKLRVDGFIPDVICAHPGWGESLFLKDVWPESRLINYCEYYHRTDGSDANFDREFNRPGIGTDARVRIKNGCSLLSLEAGDWGISPTQWQRSLFPEWARRRISVIHDGIDAECVRPDPQARLRLEGDNIDVGCGDEVVTFVSRHLEPARGFHVFMRALPELLRLRPAARVLIAGEEDGGWGASPSSGRTWKELFCSEMGADIDRSRVHFLGRLPYPQLLNLLRVSAAHVYLSYPSLRSRSLLEAMSSGCLVIGSRTAPVEEFITHGRNGLLVDFFDSSALARTVASTLARPETFTMLRRRAREDVLARYDLRTVSLPRQIALIESMRDQLSPRPEESLTG